MDNSIYLFFYNNITCIKSCVGMLLSYGILEYCLPITKHEDTAT